MAKNKKNVKRKKKDRRTLFLIVVAIIAVLLGIFLFSVSYVVFGSYDGLGEELSVSKNQYDRSHYGWKDGLRTYEDENYSSEVGVDVSVYQGEIDWSQVKEQGISYAMIRLGYRTMDSGKIMLDEMYKDNIREAKRAGLKVGVYFYSQAVNVDEAVEEARFVVRHIRGKGLEMPVVFDMEKSEGSRISKMTKRERTEATDAFCYIIQANSYQPMIYGNPRWLLSGINRGYLTDYPCWLAHYTGKKHTSAYPFEYAMWQYSDSGNVSGINGNVDMNIHLIRK